ncbi:MAG: pentapeptide repeat-containing protein [Deltaproteobacteria bacterium]|nr:pentapeptide repeat-containing protein [Deltaproteobacteria bacterium]
MSCVSQATVPEGDWIPHVDRLHIITDGQDGLAELSLQRGPQFREHAEHNQRESGPESTLTVKLSIRRNELELEGAQVRVTLSVAPGPFFRGTLRTNGLSQTLTCWDDDVLGGLWSAPTVTLPAHFDWQTGVCVDSLGRPALNVLPIELVRETGFGECADLRGLSLNDGDLNQPNLAGWALFGADLSGARLFFADLTDASLDGASFADLEFGYAHINGTFGATTQFPEVCQTLVSNPWAGQRLQCVQ